MFLEERGRPAQHGVVEIIAQIGDHAESSVVHQVRSAVVEDPLQYGGCHERIGNNGPCIVELSRNEALKIDGMAGLRISKENDVFGAGRGVQYAVKNRLQQHQAKGFQKSHASQKENT